MFDRVGGMRRVLVGLPWVLITAALAVFVHEVVVAGMAADGPRVAGTFKEGEVLTQPIQRMPGECCTVVAVGMDIKSRSVSAKVRKGRDLFSATPMAAMGQTRGHAKAVSRA